MVDDDGPGEDARTCPRCREPMVEKPVKLLVLDECLSCKGLWFDRGEFDKAFRVLTHDYTDRFAYESLAGELSSPVEKGDTAPCPACSGPMELRRLSGVDLEIDLCPACKGLWLDGGELEKFQSAGEEKRAHISRATLDDIQRNPVSSTGVQFMSDLTRSPRTQAGAGGFLLLEFLLDLFTDT